MKPKHSSTPGAGKALLIRHQSAAPPAPGPIAGPPGLRTRDRDLAPARKSIEYIPHRGGGESLELPLRWKGGGLAHEPRVSSDLD